MKTRTDTRAALFTSSLAMLLTLAITASAATIPGLVDTAQGGASPDPYWRVAAAPSATGLSLPTSAMKVDWAVSLNNGGFPYWQQRDYSTCRPADPPTSPQQSYLNDNSGWISFNRYGGPPTYYGEAPAGDYAFELTFDMSGLATSTAVITGHWWSDNTSRAYVNGQLIGALTSQPQNPGADFSVPTALLNSGLNTLGFVVNNQSPDAGTVGLRLDFAEATAFPWTPEPVITAQPQDQTLSAGAIASFMVSAIGLEPLNYQWRKDGADLADGGPVSGATTATLNIANVEDADGGDYVVVISNAAGSVTSDPSHLTIQPFTPFPGLISYWQFEEGSGSVALDSVGANHGNVVGAAWAPGVVGTALSLDGQAGVRIADDASLRPANVTYAAWVNLADFGSPNSEVMIFERDVDSYRASVVIAVDSGGYPNLHLQNGAEAVYLVSQATVPLGTWIFLGGTYDGTMARLYVDGIEAASAAYSGGIDYGAGPRELAIGGDFLGYPGFVRGLIDEAALFDRALSTAEIQTCYQNGLEGRGYDGSIPPVTAPSITVQPQSRSAIAGLTTAFTVAVIGTSPLTYQWRKDGADLNDNDRINGATTPSLTFTSVQPSDAGEYRVVIANTAGSATSEAAVLEVATSGVVAWGDNGSGQLDVPSGLSDVMAVAGGGTHSVVLRADGTVVCWGQNQYGQCNIPVGLSGVVQVSAGEQHTLALKADGTVVAWGSDQHGQGMVPMGLRDVVEVSAGGYHNLALKADGTVVAWGFNGYGQTSVPAGLSGVVAIAAGGHFSEALLGTGQVVMWGNLSWGTGDIPPELTGVVAIAAGGRHSVALKADGTVVTWGNNELGQLAMPAGLANVVAVAAGGGHSLALKSDGTVAAWGFNLDDDTYTRTLGQAEVPYGLSGVVAIGAGRHHSLAVAGEAPPLLVLLGESVMTIPRGSAFMDPGAVARDARGKDLSASIIVSVAVDTQRLGTCPLSYSVTADNGRTTTATRTVEVVSDGTDATPPVVSCPGGMTVQAGSNCEAVIPDVIPSVAATDDSGGLVTLAQDPAAGTAAPLGSYPAVVTATDEAGNTSTCTITITIADQTPPRVTLNGEATITIECGSAFVDPGASATDNCTGITPWSVSGEVDPNKVGVHTLTYSATDLSGNTDTATRTIHVVDTTPPTITCPADILAASTGPAGATVTFSPTATDNGPGASVVCAPSSGSVFPIGTTLVTATATDEAGNTSFCTFRVTVLADVMVNGPLRVSGGQIKGSVQQLAGRAVTLNGAAVITGDLLVPGTPTIITNGPLTLQGITVGEGSSQPSGYSVILNGSVRLEYLRTRVDPVAMPIVALPPPPAGTRSVVLTRPGQSAGDFSTMRNLTLNGSVGLIAVPPGNYGNFTANGACGFVLGVAGSTEPTIYAFQRLTLNSLSEVRLAGPVTVTLANSLIANGKVGVATQPAWLKLMIANGGVTLNGGCTLAASVVAPTGLILINMNSVLLGAVACDQLTLNGNGLVQGFGN